MASPWKSSNTFLERTWTALPYRSADGRPVIGLTLRYDRVDNFWWVLLHELAHATRHLRDSDHIFVDDLNHRL